MAYTADPATTQALLAKDDYVDIPFGTGMEQVWTLDTYLAHWAAGAIAEPASLAGADPVSEAYAVAQDRCGSTPTPDCNAVAQLATAYGNTVAQAWSLGGYTANGSAAAAGAGPAAAPTGSAGGLTPSAAAAGPTATGGPGPATAATVPAATAVPASQFQPHFIDSGSAGGDVGGTVAGIGLTTANPILFGVGIAISVVSGILGAIFGGSNDVQKLAKQFDQLKDATEKGLDLATRFTWAIGNGVAALWTADALIWDSFTDQLWTNFKNVWKSVWTALATTIPTILKLIHDARQLLDQVYTKYIRKIMFWIQWARTFLAYLKLLHVPFAQKLDKIIGQIQTAVFAPFLYVLGVLNLYGAWINLILTQNLTLQRPVFLNTMYEYQADWINMFWEAQSNANDPAVVALTAPVSAIPTVYFSDAGPSAASQAPPPATQLDGWDACFSFGLWVSTGGGPIAEDVDNGLAVFVATVL